MKIIQINSVCGKGSTGKIAVSLYRTMTNEGMDGRIAYGRGKDSSGVESYRIGSDSNVICHVLQNFLFGRSGFASGPATDKLIKWLDDEKPDIIHLHNIHGFYLNVSKLFAYIKEGNIPVVWTLHDCWAFTGHCAYFDFADCARWKTGCYNCPQHRTSYPYSILWDTSKKLFVLKKKAFTGVNNLHIVTPSKWLAENVKQSFLGNYDIHVINNGINLDIFKPSKSDRFRKKYGIETKFVILGVAFAWEKRKGLDSFIRLSQILDDSYAIVLVGTDDKVDSKLPDKIISIHRTQDQKELAEIYSEADVMVNPTQEETFGMVNIEALACGTPVITYSTGGCPETVSDETGAVIERGNIDALYSQIVDYRTNGKPQAFECVRWANNFEANKCYQKYIELYKKILG